MVGLKRRRKVEGWALEAAEYGDDIGRMTLRHRLGDNNRLWVVTMAAVLVISGLLLLKARQSDGPPEEKLAQPSARGVGFYDDQAHRDFTKAFASDKTYRPWLIEARFTGSNGFRITTSSDISSDDIDYMSKMAAMLILSKFKQRTVVQLYTRSALDGKEQLAATARWEPKKFGFVVRFREVNRRG